MREIFAELFKKNAQGQTNAFGSNPDTLSLASMLKLQGVPPNEAIAQAAKLNRERQLMQQEQAAGQFKMMQEQQRQQALQNIGGMIGGNVDQNQLNQLLFNGNFSPAEIANLRDTITPQAKENVVFNPVTGEALLKQIQDGRVVGFTPIQGGNQGGGVFAQTQTEMMQQPYETPVEAKERRGIENKYFETLRDEVKSTGEATSALKSVENSLKKVNTGIFSGTKQAIGGFGKEFFGSDLGTGASDLASIDAVSVNLLQPFISATKGAVSDKEMGLFQSAVPNSNQLPETNKKIIEAMRLSIERKKQKLKAANEWKKSGKSIDEFEVQWADYINNNPVVIQDSAGTIKINPKNVSNFKGWEKNAQQVEKPMESMSLESLSDADLEAIARGQ